MEISPVKSRFRLKHLFQVVIDITEKRLQFGPDKFLDAAFFNMNGYISVTIFLFTLADVVVTG